MHFSLTVQLVCWDRYFWFQHFTLAVTDADIDGELSSKHTDSEWVCTNSNLHVPDNKALNLLSTLQNSYLGGWILKSSKSKFTSKRKWKYILTPKKPREISIHPLLPLLNTEGFIDINKVMILVMAWAIRQHYKYEEQTQKGAKLYLYRRRCLFMRDITCFHTMPMKQKALLRQ